MSNLRDVPESPSGHSPLPRDVVRALQWLKPRLAVPVRLADIAAAAGVPARTLETHFRAYLGTTPLGWVRQSRLANARQQFMRGDRSIGVTEIALANGFTQPGRFARLYRETFGERPSQTRMRASALTGDGEPLDDEAAFLAWRALSSAYFVAPKECGRALDDVERAQEIAPSFGLPKGIMAWCSQRRAFNFAGRTPIEHCDVAALAESAARLTPHDALTLSVCSGAMALAHCLDDADRLIERAIAIDPWSPMAWIRRAWISTYLGDSESALREFRILLHLMPFEPMAHLAYIGIGCAHFAAGRHDRAARWARRGVECHPGSFWADRIAAAAAIHCGAPGEARRIARRLLRKDPDLTVGTARSAMPFRPNFLDRLGEGLRAAGVPLH